MRLLILGLVFWANFLLSQILIVELLEDPSDISLQIDVENVVVEQQLWVAVAGEGVLFHGDELRVGNLLRAVIFD